MNIPELIEVKPLNTDRSSRKTKKKKNRFDI